MIWLNLQALHLICWCVEQPRTYLFVFQIHWCLLPETLNTLLKPAQHWLVGHLPLVCWMVLLDSDIQQQLLKVPIQCCENLQPLLSLWCIVDPLLCFIDDIEAFHCSLPCKWYALSQVKAYIIFLIPTLLTQPQEPGILLHQRTFPITPCLLCQILFRSLSQSFSPPSVFVWKSFLPASSFVWFLTSVNGSLLFTTQHVFIL